MNDLYLSELSIHPDQSFYRGKVRDVYRIGEQLISIASDRISAFDHILPSPIPYKGQVLNQTAAYFLNAVEDIVPTWLQSQPAPHVSVGLYGEPIRIEMVIRGYIAGHAWRNYSSGRRLLCGVKMTEGLRESDPFPSPIITPATKAESGHDEDISAEEIVKKQIVSEGRWGELVDITHKLFTRGTEMASSVGLILVDTKYEFGILNDELILIDEIHTPDSSRYFIQDDYEKLQSKGLRQLQLSKEFVREWLIENDFQGLQGQKMPSLPPSFLDQISKRYIDLYEQLTGSRFIPHPPLNEIELIQKIKAVIE